MRLMIGPHCLEFSRLGARCHKSERLVGRVEDSRNLQQKYDDSSFGLCRNSPRGGSLLALVLQSFRFVLCFFCLVLSLASRAQVNIPYGEQHQMRAVAVVRGCLSQASERLTDQKTWNPSCTQNPLGSTGGPVKLRKTARP